VFKRVAQEYNAQVDFGEVNVLVNQESQFMYNIRSVPTLIFFLNGKVQQQGSITDEMALRKWLSTLAVLSPQQPQQSPPQQPPPQKTLPQQSLPQQRHQQQRLRVSGACDSLLNDVYVFKGYTVSNAPYYGSTSNRHLYHDLDCNGRGSSPRWILDDYEAPTPSNAVDLDNDNDCRYRARIEWADGVLPLGTHQWKVYCDSAWVMVDLTIEDADLVVATTTTTTTTTLTFMDIENVVVIGAGPGGMAAALYAARAGLRPIVVAPLLGGQLLSKGVDVQNYPGVPEETGVNMIATMTKQAESFDTRRVTGLVVEVNTSTAPFTIRTTDTLLQTRTIILAMGADSKWLGVPGEHALRGHGVSSCVACDGFLYKGKSCAVIGGGETAIEEALMLSRTCSSVTLIHRRNKFRARQVLQMSALKNPKIQVVWNTVVERFIGMDNDGRIMGVDDLDQVNHNHKRLTHLQLKENGSSKPSLLAIDGAFVSIGHSPNTQFLRGQVDLDEQGYIAHPSRSSQTSVPGVFAAGDVSDPVYRQAITSAGAGAMAALDAEKYISELEMHDTYCVSNLTLPDLEAESLYQHVDLGLGIASANSLTGASA
jgi:thioredoxin-disulfide reductase